MSPAEMNEPIKVFVYGSLKKGKQADAFLKNSKFISEDSVKGGLYAISFFPGIRLDEDGEVSGEVYEVDRDTLFRLDNYEGYYGTRPDSLFVRKNVTTNKGEKVCIYEFNGSVKGCHKVEDGVW